jgi:uncharacterized membrane protein
MLELSSPYPVWVYVILAVVCIVLIAVARQTAMSSRLRRWSFFLPRIVVLALLLGVLLNPVKRQEHRLPNQQPQVHFLVDASRSMALEQPQNRSLQVQKIIQDVGSQMKQQKTHPRVQLFRFGQELSSVADLSQLQPIDNVTKLAEGLEQLPTRFLRDLPRAVVVFSDGVFDDAEKLAEVARSFQSMGVPVHVYPIGDANLRGDVAIDELVVPRRVIENVRVPIRGVVRGTGFEGEQVVLQLRAADHPDLPPLAVLPITLSEKPQPFELIAEVNPDYDEFVLEIPPLKGEVSEQNNRVPFQLARVSRKLKVLYMEGTEGGGHYRNQYRFVHDALMEDNDIECVSVIADNPLSPRPRLRRVDDSSKGFPATREELMQYDCVICSDVSIGAFNPEQLDWTVELVEKHGGGFVMVGGAISFGAGNWDQTVWDELIPVDMKGGMIGRGFLDHKFRVRIPDEALSHPIWKMVDDPEQNRRILEAMPPFFGTNYMDRLKPAATILAVSATPIPRAGIMPIFACQPYGRGRSFAFAPDTTADWGGLFETQWGEGDNRYFRRFWRNVVRWLTENSTRGNKRLQIETDRVIYREGQPIRITAHAFDDQFKETIEYQLSAQVKSPDTATLAQPAAMPPQGMSYVGELDVRSLTSGTVTDSSAVLSSYEIEVIATQNGKEISRSTTQVMVLPDLHELMKPGAQSDSLKRLALATGGTTLHGPNELAAIMKDLDTSPGDSIISRQPLWDSPWLWLLIVTLLAAEWTHRRVSG